MTDLMWTFWIGPQVHYFKEQLFHFSSMKKSTRNVLFFSMVLLWYFLVFELLWCRHTMYNGVCKEPAYREVKAPHGSTSSLLSYPPPPPFHS